MNLAQRSSAAIAVTMAIAAVSASALAASPPATSWEVAGEFNEINSVGPVWSYGSKVGATFMPFGPPSSTTCMSGYLSSLPAVMHNPAMTTCYASITLGPRALVMHPGFSGEAAAVRFTAPDAALYRLSGQFYGMDQGGLQTHTSVSIVATNVIGNAWTVYAGAVALPAQGAPSFTSKYVMLRAGETIDFLVAAGPGNNYMNGSTGLNAVIERAGAWCGPTDPHLPTTTTC